MQHWHFSFYLGTQTKLLQSDKGHEEFYIKPTVLCIDTKVLVCLFTANTSQQILYLPLRLSCLMASLRCLHGIIAPLRFNFPTCLIIVSEGICSVLLNRLTGLLMLMFQVPVPQLQACRPTTSTQYVYFSQFISSILQLFKVWCARQASWVQHAVIASTQSCKALLVRRKIWVSDLCFDWKRK